MALTPRQSVTLDAIKQSAAKYNVDWRVMAALAHHESNLGQDTYGDGGHAVGPFQLNNAGGVLTGTSPQEFRSYAAPLKNADYAARALAKLGIVNGSGTVESQIAQGVNRFERPADKPSEIQDATSWYQSTLKGKTPAVSSVATGGKVANPSTQPMAQQLQPAPQGNDALRNGLLQYVMSLNSTFANGGSPSTAPTLPGLLSLAPPAQATPTAPPLAAPRAAKPTPTAPAAPTLQPGSGGFALPLGTSKFKPLGLPYQGTHGKTFNVSGGSDNWESENAIDLGTPVGTPIYAVANGKIGSQIGPMGTGRFAGQRVHLVTGNNEVYYAHLSKLAVKAGQTVQKGQLIGYSGEANGVPHLHIALAQGNPATAFNY